MKGKTRTLNDFYDGVGEFEKVKAIRGMCEGGDIAAFIRVKPLRIPRSFSGSWCRRPEIRAICTDAMRYDTPSDIMLNV